MTFRNVYFLVLLRAVDILFCTWIWRDYDITISSMAGLELRMQKPAPWAKIVGGALNWIQTNHCESAIMADIARCRVALIMLGAT